MTFPVKVFLMLLVVLSPLGMIAHASPVDLPTLRDMREKAKERPRRVIYNNDGDDVRQEALPGPATPQSMLAVRAIPLLGSQVDTIMYCTGGNSFDAFRHDTKVGRIYDGKKLFPNSKVREFIEQGNDALKIMTQFCRDNDLEIFWSHRMNDTHDMALGSSAYADDVFSPWKREHPEYLCGTQENPPPFGRWSSVDFSHPQVRDYIFSFFEEICRNYDIDGVELDFFRHPCYFKTVAMGGDATQDNLDQMTDLVRRIRRMTEEEGMKRGRPILVSIRVPDSVDYSRAIGLDIERWMSEGLVDLYMPSGYFRLNRWEKSIDLGHQYGVKVYCGHSKPRTLVNGPPDNVQMRRSDEAYRAWAQLAWNAGADGIYLYNFLALGTQRLASPMLRQIGDPATLAGKDKLYLGGYKSVIRATWYLRDAYRFLEHDPVTPERPLVIQPGSTGRTFIEVGEDVSQHVPQGGSAQVVLRLWVLNAASAEQLTVRLNGQQLTPRDPQSYGVSRDEWMRQEKKVGQIDVAGWIEYPVDPAVVVKGELPVEVFVDANNPVMMKVPVTLAEIALSIHYQPVQK